MRLSDAERRITKELVSGYILALWLVVNWVTVSLIVLNSVVRFHVAPRAGRAFSGGVTEAQTAINGNNQ
jgi:hypothetical protein